MEAINDGLDWSPYEGMPVPGSIRHVLAGGDHVVADGRFGGDEHRGRHLPVARVLETA
jgi:dihydroorotase-like cyclic amidohydrolase